MKKHLLALLIVTFMAGCSTHSGTQSQEASGIWTASAIVAAIPLAPIALGYSAIATPIETKKERTLKEEFDSAYQNKINSIKGRSPQADAYKAWTNAAIAFLRASIPSEDLYPGLESQEYYSRDGKGNEQLIRENEFLTYLQILVNDDASQKKMYFSETYKEFLNVGHAYAISFNQEMHRLIQGGKPK